MISRVEKQKMRIVHNLYALLTVLCLLSPISQSQNIINPPLTTFSCDPLETSTRSFPFCNTKLSIDDRVRDLVSRLTLDEKVSQLVNTAPAIPRLNISAYEWWSEALHGVSRHGRGVKFNGTVKSATMFPQIILTAASFDSNLWYRIAQAIGDEARAIFNAGEAKGLTFWAPNVNIFRDPRWGRGQETPGEDPLVVSKYGVAYVRGMQGDSFEGGKKGAFLKTSACCKHFTAHDLDNWNGTTRYVFDAKVSKQDLADTFQPPFKTCVEQGQASGIMCAYNQVNGVPSCADYNLLTETARETWGFKGYVVSDCDAVEIIYDQQHYAKEPEDAVKDVLQAGMDLNCGSYLTKYTKSAVAKKKISERQDIDRALVNLFSIRMRLGLFDGDPSKFEYGNISSNQVCSQSHLDLALEAARAGIVLLKNEGNLLPFSKNESSTLAVIGPSADNSTVFLGNYEGFPCKNITILQALRKNYVSSNLKYHQGCDSVVNCTSAWIDEAVNVVKQADKVVLVVGLDQTIEREKLDRVDLGLPGDQEKLITSIAQASQGPVVLVLLCGGPVDVSFARDHDKIRSILWAGYPGEAGGVAVAETLFGDHNPGGRLPVTWYPKNFTKTPMTDMRMRADPSSGYPGRTYRFYDGPKVFKFGYGLSYTNYSYRFVSVSRESLFLSKFLSKSNEELGSASYISVAELGTDSCGRYTVMATVRVENLGGKDGKHSMLLFVKNDNVRNRKPIKQLVGFESVSLSAGNSKEVEFVVSPCDHLSYADENGMMIIEQGKYFLNVGKEDYPINVM